MSVVSPTKPSSFIKSMFLCRPPRSAGHQLGISVIVPLRKQPFIETFDRRSQRDSDFERVVNGCGGHQHSNQQAERILNRRTRILSRSLSADVLTPL